MVILTEANQLLKSAVASDDLNLVKQAFAKGADPNYEQSQGKSPFNTFSHSAPKPPPVRVLHMDKELLAENMPIQRFALLGKTIRGFELEFVWEDGISKTGLWSSCPLYDENDAIVGALATCEDITHKKNTERKLALYQKQLEVSNAKLLVTDFQQHEIIDSITDGFFALDNEWRLIYINSLAEEFGFRKKDELLGKSLWDITPNAQPYYDQYHKSKIIHYTPPIYNSLPLKNCL